MLLFEQQLKNVHPSIFYMWLMKSQLSINSGFLGKKITAYLLFHRYQISQMSVNKQIMTSLIICLLSFSLSGSDAQLKYSRRHWCQWTSSSLRHRRGLGTLGAYFKQTSKKKKRHEFSLNWMLVIWSVMVTNSCDMACWGEQMQGYFDCGLQSQSWDDWQMQLHMTLAYSISITQCVSKVWSLRKHKKSVATE